VNRTPWILSSVAIFAIVALGPFVINTATGHLLKGVDGPNPTPAMSGDECLRPADEMRAHHMNYLHSVMDSMRHMWASGIDMGEASIETDFSFDKCQECHPTRGDFCDRCHDFVGVVPKCWECHDYPQTAADL